MSRAPAQILLLAVPQLLVELALGLLGIVNLTAYFGGAGRATVTVRTGKEVTTRVYDTNEEMERELPGYKAILVGTSVFAVGLGGAALLGAVGMMLGRAWGWWLTLLWALADAPYRLITVVFWWTVMRPAANKIVERVPRDEGMVCNGLVNSNTFFHIGWGLFAAAFFFYSALMLLLIVLPPFRRPLLQGAPAPRDRDNEDEDERPRRRSRYRNEDE